MLFDNSSGAVGVLKLMLFSTFSYKGHPNEKKYSPTNTSPGRGMEFTPLFNYSFSNMVVFGGVFSTSNGFLESESHCFWPGMSLMRSTESGYPSVPPKEVRNGAHDILVVGHMNQHLRAPYHTSFVTRCTGCAGVQDQALLDVDGTGRSN